MLPAVCSPGESRLKSLHICRSLIPSCLNGSSDTSPSLGHGFCIMQMGFCLLSRRLETALILACAGVGSFQGQGAGFSILHMEAGHRRGCPEGCQPGKGAAALAIQLRCLGLGSMGRGCPA